MEERDVTEINLAIKELDRIRRTAKVMLHPEDYAAYEQPISLAIEALNEKRKRAEWERNTPPDIKKAIAQLEDLRRDRESFLDGADYEIYKADIAALDVAIKAIHERTEQKSATDSKLGQALMCCGSDLGQNCAECPYEYCSKQCENLCVDAAIKIEELKAENAWLRKGTEAIQSQVAAYQKLGLTPEEMTELAEWKKGKRGVEEHLAALAGWDDTKRKLAVTQQLLNEALEWADRLCKNMLNYNTEEFLYPIDLAEKYKKWRGPQNEEGCSE